MNGTVLYARVWLNKVTLNLLLRYKESVGSDKSVERLMVEMHNPTTGLKCFKLNME